MYMSTCGAELSTHVQNVVNIKLLLLLLLLLPVDTVINMQHVHTVLQSRSQTTSSTSTRRIDEMLPNI